MFLIPNKVSIQQLLFKEDYYVRCKDEFRGKNIPEEKIQLIARMLIESKNKMTKEQDLEEFMRDKSDEEYEEVIKELDEDLVL